MSASNRIRLNSVFAGLLVVTTGWAQTPTPAPTPGCTDDTWTATTTTDAPTGRQVPTAVWTGSEMIVWGGYIVGTSPLNTGGRYNPSTDSWVATTTTNAPTARISPIAVWTGSEMIVWGGYDFSTVLNTGGRYNPITDSWVATTTTNAPARRSAHTAVWTGSEMIVWGGLDNSKTGLNTGGRYNPSTDSWIATTTANAPAGRDKPTGIWTGSEMIVWGGFDLPNRVNTGGRYNPITNSWVATTTTNAPSGREDHTAVWTGSKMIVWGGFDGIQPLNTGSRYDPITDSWVGTTITNAPEVRDYHRAVWTGNEMIVWGGSGGGTLNTGGRYDPSTDSWVATATTDAPGVRYFHAAVWTGSEMIVWGGYDNSSVLNTGGRYCAQPPPTPTPGGTQTPTPGGTPTPTPGGTPTPTPPTPATQALNLSTRLRVQPGDNRGIGGIIITGTDPKRVLFRGIGPSLTGVPDALADPVMELHGRATTMTNDNWRDTQEAEIIATGLAPTNDLESAIVVTLDPGLYTAIVGGKNDTSGVGLIEAYDLNSATANSMLANISTRAFVDTGNNVVIAGFILGGNSGDENVIVRGIGPSLTAMGVPGALADPTLELHNGNGALLIANNDWQDDPSQAAIISAAGLAPTNSLESAIASTLSPGLYTAILAGLNNGIGVGQVEVYDLGAP